MLIEILGLLKTIDERLTKIERSVEKMDSHVDFVEEVYENVKSPFHKVLNIFSTPTLPSITY